MINDADAFLRNILLTVKTIAMVGASDKETRPSYVVFSYLLARGYQVIGVNPSLAGKSVHGAAFFKTLADVPEPIDMVDIFRNSQVAEGIVDEALALDPRPQVIWMQLGVRDDAAAARARALGVEVVMNRCLKIEYERLASPNYPGPTLTHCRISTNERRRLPLAPRGAAPPGGRPKLD